MTYLCVDKDGTERIIECEIYCERKGGNRPYRFEECCWGYNLHNDVCIELPKGTIKKILGRELTWEDEPVELK